MQSACAVPINSFKSALNSPRNHRALLVLNPHTSAALKRLVGPHFTPKYCPQIPRCHLRKESCPFCIWK